jgi:CRP-like cAMP-binding protein
MAPWHDVLTKKLSEHSRLRAGEIAALRSLPDTTRSFGPNQDIVRQGDKPDASVVVLNGMLARYHTLRDGGRQYLSLHIAGDMPDAQALFLEKMDHSLCALDDAVISLVPHTAFLKLFEQRPSLGFAIWRETLIDAAIFRQAITNNSARPLLARLAHFFCEQYYRASAAGLTKSGSCSLPLTQAQIGETVGASLPSISRTLQALRATGFMELRTGRLQIHKWSRLVEFADFNPDYLHLRKPP